MTEAAAEVPASDAPADAEREGGRRRGRGRQRREAREDGPTAEPFEAGDSQAPQDTVEVAPVAAAATEAVESAPAAPAEPPVAAPAAPITPEPAAAAAPAVAVMAAVEPFELPLDKLHSLAESAGLQWVNSDAERIRAAQEAMANEPKPSRVVRAPRPRVAVDEGPLVLVETRKDLSQMKLPFDAAGRANPAAH